MDGGSATFATTTVHRSKKSFKASSERVSRRGAGPRLAVSIFRSEIRQGVPKFRLALGPSAATTPTSTVQFFNPLVVHRFPRPRTHPIAKQRDGGIGFGEGASPNGIKMLHPGGDMQRCIDAGRSRIAHQAN